MAGDFPTPLPVRLRLNVTASAMQAGYHEVVVTKGHRATPFAGFGFFGHRMQGHGKEDLIRTVATGCIDSDFWKVLLAKDGGLEFFHRMVGGHRNRQFPISFDDGLKFEILALQGTRALGNQKLRQLGVK